MQNCSILSDQMKSPSTNSLYKELESLNITTMKILSFMSNNYNQITNEFTVGKKF